MSEVSKASFDFEFARATAFRILDLGIAYAKAEADDDLLDSGYYRLFGQLSILKCCGLISDKEYEIYNERIVDVCFPE